MVVGRKVNDSISEGGADGYVCLSGFDVEGASDMQEAGRIDEIDCQLTLCETSQEGEILGRSQRVYTGLRLVAPVSWDLTVL